MEEFSVSLDLDDFYRLIDAAASEIGGDLAVHRKAIIERVKGADTGASGEMSLQVQMAGQVEMVGLGYHKEDFDAVDLFIFGSGRVVSAFEAILDRELPDEEEALGRSGEAAMSPPVPAKAQAPDWAATLEKEWLREEGSAYEDLLEELRALGVRQPGDHPLREVENVSLKQYPQARPVLLRWFPKMRSLLHKYEVAAALASINKPDAATADVIMDEYDRLPAELRANIKELIAATVESVAHDDNFERLVEHINRAEDPHRWRFVWALGRMRKRRPEAVALLLKLLDDDELVGYAIHPLGDLKAAEALPRIRAFAQGPPGNLRNGARQVLPALEKAVARRILER